MSFTRKHYEAIAAIIREAHKQHTDHAPIIFMERQLAGLFASDNPRFDRSRFLSACGLED